jgi:two-component system, cell cycle response regulator
MGDFEDDAEKTAVLGAQDVAILRENISRNAYLIVINGRSVGKMYKLVETQSWLGRAADCFVIIDDEGVSRKHAVIDAQGEFFTVSDSNSTNGIFINGERVNAHQLADGDRLQIGSNTILKFSYQDEVEENYQKKLYDSATRDSMTGAYNKKFFADQLKTEFAFCFRHKTVLSLMLFDLDHFKKLNDGWGHLAGDLVLKEVAAVVQALLRTEDIFARYGGEEFGVILRDTDAERAFLIAERIRRAIEAKEFMYEDDRLPVHISAGVSTLAERNHASATDLVRAADRFLYKAKEFGRNRTECALMES